MSYQKLFDYMSKEHGVTLLESDMSEIINIVNEQHNSQWRPIEEIDTVEDGTIVCLIDLVRDSIVHSTVIYYYNYNHKNNAYNKNYTHFLIIPKL